MSPSKLNGLNMVVALTQDTINYQIKLLHGAGIIKPNLDIVLTGDNAGIELHAKLAAPTVELGVRTDRSRAYLALSMPSGTLKYYAGSRAKPKLTSMDFTDWSFVFGVALDMQTLAAEALKNQGTIPEEVRKHLEAFKPDMFTIQHLFLDLENVNLADFDDGRSKLTWPSKAPDPTGGLEAVKLAFLDYFQSLKTSNNPYILGYTVENTTNSAPSALDPTSSTFNTTKNPDQGNSTLNFLLMTGHETLPNNAALGTFDWLTPGKSFDGRMVIAHDTFWEKWVLPSLGLGDIKREGDGWTLATKKETKQHKPNARGEMYTETIVDLSNTQVSAPSQNGSLRLKLVGFVEHTDDLSFDSIWASGQPMHVDARVDWSADVSLSAGNDGKIALEVQNFQSSVTKDEADGSKALGDLTQKHLAEKLNGFKISHLSQQLVLPAGDVFFFKNLKLEDTGDMVLDITYSHMP
jgi:hypothetical protein